VLVSAPSYIVLCDLLDACPLDATPRVKPEGDGGSGLGDATGEARAIAPPAAPATPTRSTPAFNSTKASHAYATGPRLVPPSKRGRIQNATPIVSCTVQPMSKNSTCGVKRRHITPWRAHALNARMRAPSEKPATRYASDARMNQRLRTGIPLTAP
jgi:hypothetical protein